MVYYLLWEPSRASGEVGLRAWEVNVLQVFWVAVEELKLSYYIGETLLFPVYTHYGNPKP